MVKYTVAASVTLLHLVMFSQTSVALPIEQYPEGLESRAISNPNDQQLAERDNTELEAREPINFIKAAVYGGGALATGVVIKHLYDNYKAKQAGAQGAAAQGAGAPGANSQQPIPDQKQITDGESGEAPGSPGQRRDLSELDSRDWEEIAKRYFSDVLDKRDGASPEQADAPPSKNRRDFSDLYERAWDEDEYEKRSFNEFEERDWDDYEMEARGLDFDELDELD